MDFTVVVPTHNRPAELTGCVRSLALLDYPKGCYEIVAVDDGGTADLTEALRAAAGAVSVRLLVQENQGPGAARNAGARAARGRWLAFTDDDCRPHPGWLSGLRAALEGGRDVLAGGRTYNQLTGNPYSSASQLIVDAAYAYFNRDRARGRFVASNNAGVDRAEFLAAGGFDEGFRVASEDRDLCDRWVWGGRCIVWTDAAKIGHRHDLTFPGFVRQHYAYGRGAARFHRARARRGSGRFEDQLSFHFQWWELLLRPALASRRPAAALALLASWQAANTAGFLREVLGRLGRRA